MEQTEQPTDQPTTLTGTRVPQDTQTDANTFPTFSLPIWQYIKIDTTYSRRSFPKIFFFSLFFQIITDYIS